MNRAARIGLICISVVIFCYAGIGHVLGRTPDDKAYKSLTVFGEVLQKIQQDYVDEPNMHTVTAGSLHGLLESLDTQSSYLTPREYDEFKKKTQSASTGESGITLSKRFGYVYCRFQFCRTARRPKPEFIAAIFLSPSAVSRRGTCRWDRLPIYSPDQRARA